jgi:hypothetical protein
MAARATGTAMTAGTAGSTAERRAARERAEDAQQAVTEFLFQRIQLSPGLENGQKIDLEFRHGLHPGAGQFTTFGGDDRDLGLSSRQIPCQNCGGERLMGRFQGLIRPFGLSASEICDQSGQLRLLIRGERRGVRFRNRVLQKAQWVALGPLLRHGKNDAACQRANQNHRDGY